MSRLTEFQQLSNANEYLDFFNIEYDEALVSAKRFHMLKFFGDLIKKIDQSGENDEEKILEFYKFALLSVYKNYENGFNPSAADVWNMFENPSACMTCATMSSCTPEDVTKGTTSCSTEKPTVQGL